MRLMKTFTSLVMLVIISSSCGNLRIKTEMPYQADAKIKNVALAALYLHPPVLPVSPVGDASAFNRKLIANKIEIEELFKAEVARMTNELGMGLQAQMALTSFYGESLMSLPSYDRIASKAELEPLKVENEIFNSILLAKGSVNAFEFEEGKIKDYIEESPRLRSQVRSLAKGLNSELVAFADAQIVVDKVQRYGVKANVRLLVEIYFFDEDGKLVGQTYGETEPFLIDGESAQDFRPVFQAYPVLQKLILTDLQKTEGE